MQEEIFCPLCEVVTEHRTIKRGREHLVQCQVCKTVHPLEEERTKQARLRVIVSREDASQRYQINVPADEILLVGEEILVDDELHEVVPAQITSIESEGEQRREQALAKEIKTLWARAVDRVGVKFSVHKRAVTSSHIIYASGEEIVEVGEIRMAGKTRFVVEKIKLRDGRFAKRAQAKDVLRAWGRGL